MLFFVIILNAGTTGIYISGAIRGSRRIHKQLAEMILGTTIRRVHSQTFVINDANVSSRWLDKTPTSRIVTRFTQDINAGELLFF